MLPWFENMRPLYLAPMAGVTDSVFRRLCKEHGADVLVTEFVSADGILHRNQRTREMLSFRAEERPVGVQLFGADPQRMAEAAKSVRDWVRAGFYRSEFWLSGQQSGLQARRVRIAKGLSAPGTSCVGCREGGRPVAGHGQDPLGMEFGDDQCHDDRELFWNRPG